MRDFPGHCRYLVLKVALIVEFIKLKQVSQNAEYKINPMIPMERAHKSRFSTKYTLAVV